jgi:transcription antitermination factor NusG
MLYEPLFPTFVFVYITEGEMHEVKKTSDVINFVYWLGKPAVIKNTEVENAAHFANLYHNIKLEKTAVNSGGIIRITNEPTLNVAADIISVNTTKIKLTLPSIGFAMVAETEKALNDIFQRGIENSNVLV